MANELICAQLSNLVYYKTRENKTPPPAGWAEDPQFPWIPDDKKTGFSAEVYVFLDKTWRKLTMVSSQLCKWMVIGVVSILAGCSTAVNLKWTEEVQMTDGAILLVDRTAKGEIAGSNTMGGPDGWSVTEMTLAIKNFHNSALPPLWQTTRVPILLEYQSVDNTWTIVATFYACTGWYELGRPPLPYLEYQSRNGEPWQIVPLEQRLMGRKTNLLADMNSRGEPRLITVQERNMRNRTDAPKFRTILAKWNTTC